MALPVSGLSAANPPHYPIVDTYPLHAAIRQKKRLPEILPLITLATVNQKDSNQFTPLQLAIANNNGELTAALLDKKADLHSFPLVLDCVKYESIEAFSVILSKLPTETIKELVDIQADSSDETPLYAACNGRSPAFFNYNTGMAQEKISGDETKREELVELLVKAGAKINVHCGQDQKTPLHGAVASKNKAILSCLLRAQPEAANEKDKGGYTPFYYAAQNCLPELVTLFVKANANLQCALDGQTAIFVTAQAEWPPSHPTGGRQASYSPYEPDHSQLQTEFLDRQLHCLKILLDKYPQHVNDKDSLDCTVLYHLCKQNNKEAVKLLLNCWADAGIVNGFEENSALHALLSNQPVVATEELELRKIQIATLLLTSKPDLANYKNKSGYTPLFYVSCNRVSLKLVKLLLDYKASVMDRQGPNEETLIHSCARAVSSFSENESDKSSQIISVLSLFLDAVPNLLHTPDKSGYTPIYDACRQGTLETVAFLLDRGAKIAEKQGENEETALHVSLQASISLLLLKQNSTLINARDKKGFTPIYSACRRLETHKSLPTFSPIPNPFEVTCTNITALIEAGAILNEKYGPREETILHLMIRSLPNISEQRPTCKPFQSALTLLCKNCPEIINMRDRQGSTPLYYACEGEVDYQIITSLIELHADAQCGPKGLTALHIAAKSLMPARNARLAFPIFQPPALPTGHLAFLLNFYTGQKNSEDEKGCPPIYYACQEGSAESVKILMEAGCEVDGRYGPSRETLLHTAVKRRFSSEQTAIIFLLLKFKSLIDTPDNRGLPPLYYACRQGSIEIARLLLEAGANGKALYGTRQETALHIAVRYYSYPEHKQVILLLLEKMPDLINIPDKKGFIPLDYATRKGQKEAEELLLAAGAESSQKEALSIKTRT